MKKKFTYTNPIGKSGTLSYEGENNPTSILFYKWEGSGTWIQNYVITDNREDEALDLWVRNSKVLGRPLPQFYFAELVEKAAA